MTFLSSPSSGITKPGILTRLPFSSLRTVPICCCLAGSLPL
ncbi:Uncharacterised protein [Vibrio cholerae]|nr:Uncharacterised protein [Vibrio cholerae]